MATHIPINDLNDQVYSNQKGQCFYSSALWWYLAHPECDTANAEAGRKYVALLSNFLLSFRWQYARSLLQAIRTQPGALWPQNRIISETCKWQCTWPTRDPIKLFKPGSNEHWQHGSSFPGRTVSYLKRSIEKINVDAGQFILHAWIILCQSSVM